MGVCLGPRIQARSVSSDHTKGWRPSVGASFRWVMRRATPGGAHLVLALPVKGAAAPQRRPSIDPACSPNTIHAKATAGGCQPAICCGRPGAWRMKRIPIRISGDFESTRPTCCARWRPASCPVDHVSLNSTNGRMAARPITATDRRAKDTKTFESSRSPPPPRQLPPPTIGHSAIQSGQSCRQPGSDAIAAPRESPERAPSPGKARGPISGFIM